MKTGFSARVLRAAIPLFALATLAACASSPARFACPFEDTGVGCKSTLEVYELTNHSGVYDARGQGAAGATAPRRGAAAVNAHQVGVHSGAMALAGPVQAGTGPFTNSQALSLGPAGGPVAPVPLHDAHSIARLPAQVMRIWVAPWTDERGDLHRPSHIYTEIVSRRWAVGGDVRADDGVRASFDPNGPMFPKHDFQEGN